MILGVDVDQRGLMPGVAQHCGPSLHKAIGMIRNRLVIAGPWAAGLGCARHREVTLNVLRAEAACPRAATRGVLPRYA